MQIKEIYDNIFRINFHVVGLKDQSHNTQSYFKESESLSIIRILFNTRYTRILEETPEVQSIIIELPESKNVTGVTFWTAGVITKLCEL